MARATAVFTDVDLFQVAIKPAPPPPGPTVHVGLQTDPILACDTGTTTTRRSDAGTSTTADAASQRSSGSSVSAGTSTSEDGKDGGDGEGKGGDGDDGGDSASARRLAAAHMPGAAAMLRRSAGAMEAEVLANLRSVALRGYPPEPVGSSLLGGGAEGFAGLLTTGGVGGDGGAGGSVGPGGCKHHCTLRCGGVGSASATAGLEVCLHRNVFFFFRGWLQIWQRHDASVTCATLYLTPSGLLSSAGDRPRLERPRHGGGGGAGPQGPGWLVRTPGRPCCLAHLPPPGSSRHFVAVLGERGRGRGRRHRWRGVDGARGGGGALKLPRERRVPPGAPVPRRRGLLQRRGPPLRSQHRYQPGGSSICSSVRGERRWRERR